MRVNDTQIQMSNYSEFKSSVGRFGLSNNNFYEVVIEIPPSSPLYIELLKTRNLNISEVNNLMRIYTEEASLPGIQISTGEYRINNTPTLKYGYGAVFSEISLSFLLDADARIKSVFDVWTNWIYGYSSKSINLFDLESNSSSAALRSRYRDDYAVDIIITKYERSMSSHSNRTNIVEEIFNLEKSYSIKQIIPGTNNSGPSKFYKAKPTYAVRLFKAFPSNVSSVSLTRGDTELSKLSVGFEFETMTSSALNEGFINGSVRDPINGGSDNNLFDLGSFFGL
jgi:hypothetical protein